jgi:hypothetical protein
MSQLALQAFCRPGSWVLANSSNIFVQFTLWHITEIPRSEYASYYPSRKWVSACRFLCLDWFVLSGAVRAALTRSERKQFITWVQSEMQDQIARSCLF